MRNLFLLITTICVVILNCDGKRGGFGGFSSRGGGSRPSSSGGWSFGGSRPSPSYSRPSPSYSRPAPAPAPSYKPPSSPSYGWNIPSSSNSQAKPSYGWNVGGSNTQTASKPSSSSNIGWNVGGTSNAKPAPSAPVGPPPSYPGLSNRPVPSNNAPPAYSPSNYNPPAYSPSYNKPSYPSPSYNKPSYSPSYPSYSSNNYRPSYQPAHTSYHSPSYSSGGYYGNTGYNHNNYGYGSTFGNAGLPGNTYISNNYYGTQQRSGFGSGGSGFLTNALFYGAGMHHGYMWGNRNSYDSYGYNRRRWDEDDDRRWRATTKAPYFENKVPGADVILPASAVVGAATAFGLISLLPLNVPSNKPLMYCNHNASDISQTQIFMNGNVYQCVNDTILISNFNCLKLKGSENVTNSLNETTSTTTTTSTESSINSMESSTTTATNLIDSCKDDSKIMHCDGEESVYCVNGTLLSRLDIFCNSTTFINGTANLNQSMMILNCYEGKLADKQTGFIPTTTTTQAPITTTEKSLSFASKVHVFLMRLIGRGDAMDKPVTTTTEAPPEIPQQSVDETIPVWVPEALTIPPETTEAPTTTPKMIWVMKNSKVPVDDSLVSLLDSLHDSGGNDAISMMYTKIISTTEASITENSSSSTEAPKMIWIDKKSNTPVDEPMQILLDNIFAINKNDTIYDKYSRVPSITEKSSATSTEATSTTEASNL